jgi:hypothetical protein
MYCTNCGKPVERNFCTNCGFQLTNGPTPAAQKQKAPTPSVLINDKWANALFENGEMNAIGKFLVSGPGAKIGMEFVKKLTGGIWVGGTAFLYTDALIFKPNLVNKMVHAGDVSWRIPLEDVLDVATQWAIGTDIITIHTAEGKFKIRCWGAKTFAVQIDQQRKILKK